MHKNKLYRHKKAHAILLCQFSFTNFGPEKLIWFIVVVLVAVVALRC